MRALVLDQDQDRIFWSQTGFVLRPTVSSDHITDIVLRIDKTDRSCRTVLRITSAKSVSFFHGPYVTFHKILGKSSSNFRAILQTNKKNKVKT